MLTAENWLQESFSDDDIDSILVTRVNQTWKRCEELPTSKSRGIPAHRPATRGLGGARPSARFWRLASGSFKTAADVMPDYPTRTEPLRAHPSPQSLHANKSAAEERERPTGVRHARGARGTAWCWAASSVAACCAASAVAEVVIVGAHIGCRLQKLKVLIEAQVLG